MTLHLGRWEEALAGVECDALIFDGPFSKRCHDGYRTGTNASDGYGRAQVDYQHWSESHVRAFVASWAPRVRGWIVSITDSDLAPYWRSAFDDAGLYSFQPLPCIMPGMTCRLSGDGPSSEAIYAMVARPKTRAMQKWGTLPGFYLTRQASGNPPAGAARRGGGGRGKPLDLMRALVRDYSRPGDLICDPCAGYATTGIAALSMGRRFIGAECDPAAHAEGLARLSRVQPVELPGFERAKQEALL